MEHHLSNDDFFTKLANLFDSRRERGHGSVFLTQKRLTHTNEAQSSSATKVADDPLWDLNPPNPLPVLIRATDGNSKDKKKSKKDQDDKIKLSTVVQPDQMEAFYTRYGELCKTGMSALKKRDRSKRKKGKGKKGKATGEAKKEG